jgi:hypothetical protein
MVCNPPSQNTGSTGKYDHSHFILLLRSLPGNPGNYASAGELRLIIERMPPMS